MKKLNFKITIHATKEKVWEALWDEANYPEWTKAFDADSRAITDGWQEGTEVKFVGSTGEGMISRVAENRMNEYMAFEHLGEIKADGTEDRASDKVKAWVGARETYTLSENEGITEVTMNMDTVDEYVDMFMGMWPKALERVKVIAER